jgi:hypothetical protein
LSKPNPATQAKIADNYGKLPLSFEANRGQADPQVKFLSRTSAYSLFLTGDEAVLTLPAKKTKKTAPVETRLAASADRETASVLRMRLRNANSAAKVSGIDELAGTSNYFIGNDPAKWRTNVPTYAKVKYEGIYNGIDLVYYGNQRQLEYDFIVSPGADPSRIAFSVSGAQRIHQTAQGDLIFQMNDKRGEDEIRWHKPVVYQEKNGARQKIAAHYAITDKNRVGFELAKYDSSRPLFIDPLIYSTYLGTFGTDDQANAIVVDSAGNAYLTGITTTGFPTMDPLQPAYGGGASDAFVTKLNPTGTALVYSTYLGGNSTDQGFGIAVDSGGNAYIIGLTESTNFPTMNPLQPAYGGGASDGFVAKINPTGSALVYSTYLGGSDFDQGNGIAVDSMGSAYVTGGTCSTDFPTVNPSQPTYGGGVCPRTGPTQAYGDAFVAKLNPQGSALAYSTYLGGSKLEAGRGIAVDSAGYAYVAGDTCSGDFPTVNPLQSTYGGGLCPIGAFNDYRGDAFVTKLDPSGSALVYSTFLGGSGSDGGSGIAADGAGNAYVIGAAGSSNFPTMNPVQPTNNSVVGTAFVTKINPTGSIFVYSTYLGGSVADYGYSIVADSEGSAYVTGLTQSKDFPVTHLTFQKICRAGTLGQCADAFVTKLNSTGSALIYSTYLGGGQFDAGYGIALDSAGNTYITGQTFSRNFPVTPGAFQTVCNGGFRHCSEHGEAFVTKFSIAAAVTTTILSSSPNPSTFGQPVTFTAAVTAGIGVPTDGGTVSFMKGKTVLGAGMLSGGSASFTTSTLKVGTTVVTAVYGGDSNFAGSKSKPVKQVVNVVPKLISITVGPVDPLIGIGKSVQFTAIGAYSDGSTKDLTSSAAWNSSDPHVATIVSGGLATGVTVGTTTIAATSGSISGGTALTVN